jgi:hypothetical protein
MPVGFLAMQLAVASHYGDKRLLPLVRRLWSATRASDVPDDVRDEIEGCTQDLLNILREPGEDFDERLRTTAERVEDVYVAVALRGSEHVHLS